MNTKLINELSEQSSEHCVSIVLDTRMGSFADKPGIGLKIKNTIKRVREELEKHMNNEEMDQLIDQIDKGLNSIDYAEMPQGLGLYIHPGYMKLVKFPLPVEDSIQIGTGFDLHAISEVFEKMESYAVLLLSKGKTRFFEGKGMKLKEVTDRNFPVKFENEYQVSRTSPGSFYNDEESKINDARLNQFFRKLDEAMNDYDTGRLVLLGVDEYLAQFKSQSNKHIVAEVKGNYDKHSAHEISELVWNALEEN